MWFINLLRYTTERQKKFILPEEIFVESYTIIIKKSYNSTVKQTW
jgi:hypothetical protein